MSLFDRNRKQDATLWTLTGSTTAFAEPVYAAPIAIKVRWEERDELFLNNAGEKVVGHDVVYLGTDVKGGDFLALGTFTATTPVGVAKVVKDFKKTPDLRVLGFERRALL